MRTYTNSKVWLLKQNKKDLVNDVFFVLQAEPHASMWQFFIRHRHKKIVGGR
ncbi:hypothetical protein IV70_GL000677 [Carnobacterium maltaromaticum DSM 20342]|nr:hypothetical protein IV70_GL000677 [Carnobacterium maltaromaticum DSM 20342]